MDIFFVDIEQADIGFEFLDQCITYPDFYLKTLLGIEYFAVFRREKFFAVTVEIANIIAIETDNRFEVRTDRSIERKLFDDSKISIIVYAKILYFCIFCYM